MRSLSTPLRSFFMLAMPRSPFRSMKKFLRSSPRILKPSKSDEYRFHTNLKFVTSALKRSNTLSFGR